MWVVDSIGHLGADRVADLLQQCVGAATKSIFGNKPSGRSCKESHSHKPWFNVNCHTMKCELFWLKTNLDSHVVKHQESKLKNLSKKKRFFWENAKAQHMCALTKVDALSIWKKYQPRAPLWTRLV